MATQQEYTVVANALVAKANSEIDSLVSTLPFFEQAAVRSYYAGHINALAGAAAQVAVDTLDAYRASLQAHALNVHAMLSKK